MVQEVFYTTDGPYRDEPPKTLAIIAVVILISTYLMKLFGMYKIPMPLKCLMIIVSSLIIIAVILGNYLHKENVVVNPRNLLLLIHPIIILKVTFDIDMELFKRVLPQVLILSTMGVVINSSLMGAILMLWHTGWTDYGIIAMPLFGFAVGSIDENEHHNEREYENLKLVYIMMQGECLLGTAVCILSINICLGYFEGIINTWYHVVCIIIRSIMGGIIFGGIMGKFLTFCLVQMFNQPLHVAIFTLAGVYSTYYITQNLLFFSSTLATFIVAVLIVKERPGLSEATFELLTQAVNFFYVMIYYVMTFQILINIILRSYKTFQYRFFLQYMLTYIAGLIGRFLTLIIISPLISNLGRGMNIKTFIFLFWLAKRGMMQMLLFLLIYHHRVANAVINFYGSHTFIYILLTFLINGVSEKIVLRVFGLIGISPEKNAHMDQCVKYIYSKKEHFISTMKMNRNLTYVNWELVDKFTKLGNFTQLHTEEDIQESVVKTRVFYCGDCRKEVVLPPTKKELQRLSLSVKSRCLVIHKISFIRQAERGVIANDSKSLLLILLDKAKESDSQLFDIQRMIKSLKTKHWPEKIIVILNEFNLENETQPPRKFYRRICYNITTNKYYELIIFIYVVVTYLVYSVIRHRTFVVAVLHTLVFGTHIFLKIQAYSHIYLKKGIKTFFNNYWNITDFIIFIAAFLDLILFDIIFVRSNEEGMDFEDIPAFTLMTVTMLNALRFLKIISVIYKFRKEIIYLCERIISVRIGRGLDMLQGLVNSFEEILHMLPTIVDNEEVRTELREKFLQDKRVAISYMYEVQKNMNWIAVTVKTKRVIRRVLYLMRSTLLDFKNKDLLAETEFVKLMAAHERCTKFVLTLIRVPLKTPQNIFNELPWLYDQKDFSDMFFSFGIPMKWRANESICGEGFVVPGIYVIVEGMVILKYNPTNIEELAGIGALPCKDYINDSEFDKPSTLILIPGNTFGEISVMTKRLTHCTAVADVPTKGYFIPIFLISQILTLKDNLEATGLYSSFWKYISQNLSNWLLWNTPVYSSMLKDEANFYFRKGFVPNMTQRNFFVATDLIEDLVLIEGRVEDLNSGEIIVGPKYLRRSSVHLLLIEENGVTPILFILPLKDEYAEMIMTTIAKSSKIIINTLERRTQKIVPQVPSETFNFKKSLRDSTELIKEKAELPPSPKVSLRKNSEGESVLLLTSSGSKIKKRGKSALKIVTKYTTNNQLDSNSFLGYSNIEWFSDEDLSQYSQITGEASTEISDIEDSKQESSEFTIIKDYSQEAATSSEEVNAKKQFKRDDSSHYIITAVEKLLKKSEQNVSITSLSLEEKKKKTVEQEKKDQEIALVSLFAKIKKQSCEE